MSQKLAEALAAARAQVSTLVKDGHNRSQNYRFASAQQVFEHAGHVLAAQGLSFVAVSTDVVLEKEQHQVVVTYQLLHADGSLEVKSKTPVHRVKSQKGHYSPLDKAVAAARTLDRRQAYVDLLCIAAVDPSEDVDNRPDSIRRDPAPDLHAQIAEARDELAALSETLGKEKARKLTQKMPRDDPSPKVRLTQMRAMVACLKQAAAEAERESKGEQLLEDARKATEAAEPDKRIARLESELEGYYQSILTVCQGDTEAAELACSSFLPIAGTEAELIAKLAQAKPIAATFREFYELTKLIADFDTTSSSKSAPVPDKLRVERPQVVPPGLENMRASEVKEAALEVRKALERERNGT